MLHGVFANQFLYVAVFDAWSLILRYGMESAIYFPLRPRFIELRVLQLVLEWQWFNFLRFPASGGL